MRQSGKRIRIGAQLVNVADGYRVWSERYDRQMEDVFDVQDEIARSIAEALKVRLLPAEEAGLSTRGTANVEAYNDYLKGLYYFNRRDAPEAITEFERALSRDPGYVEAYTGLADSYGIYGFYGGIPTREAFARARAAAQKALELQPDSAECTSRWRSSSTTSDGTSRKRKRKRGERSAWLRLPRRPTPGSACCSGSSAGPRRGWRWRGRRRSSSLFSPNAQANVAWVHYASRRFEEGVAEFRRALHMDPNAAYPLWAIGMTYLQMGRHADAIRALEKAVEVNKRRQSHFVALLGGAYAAADRKSEAQDILDELTKRSATEYVAPFHLAFLHVPMGNAEEAIACLDRALDERNALAWWPRYSPFYDPLRSHPRFPALLAKIVPA